MLAIWAWDDGSELSAIGSRKYYAGCSKWTNPDNLYGNKTNGDEADLKLWEFDNCLVQDTDPQEEQKVEDDEKEKEGNEEDEEPKMSTNGLGNIMSPTSKSAKKKSKSRKSKIDKALLLDDLDSDVDDESGATSTTKKKSKEGKPKRSQSLSEKEEDFVVGKSKKKKEKTSTGSKLQKSKMRKGISSRNVTGELQRKLGGDDDHDGIELSRLNNALLSPRNTKKRGKRRSTWWDISALPSD